MRYIGDVHGKYRQYKRLIEDVPASIQIGDMGVGFRDYNKGEFKENPPFDAMAKGNHRFIRGNHDNPLVCSRHKFWIPDGTVDDEGRMFVGGALSIDRMYRIPGYSYWENEELSTAELHLMMEVYYTKKPKMMITHECPEFFAQEVMMGFNSLKIDDHSRTRQAFDAMFEMHKPDVWIFGHWHNSVRKERQGTEFICLAELEHLDID